MSVSVVKINVGAEEIVTLGVYNKGTVFRDIESDSFCIVLNCETALFRRPLYLCNDFRKLGVGLFYAFRHLYKQPIFIIFKQSSVTIGKILFYRLVSIVIAGMFGTGNFAGPGNRAVFCIVMQLQAWPG